MSVEFVKGSRRAQIKGVLCEGANKSICDGVSFFREVLSSNKERLKTVTQDYDSLIKTRNNF